MRKSQESTAVLDRIEATSDFWIGEKISLLRFKAVASGFIQLDEKYHLEGVMEKLKELQLILFTTAMSTQLSSDAKEMYMSQWHFLNDLLAEFEWQKHYGIRLYEPL